MFLHRMREHLAGCFEEHTQSCYQGPGQDFGQLFDGYMEQYPNFIQSISGYDHSVCGKYTYNFIKLLAYQ